MMSELTPYERSWLRALYADELGLPINEPQDDDVEEGELMLLGHPLEPMFVARNELALRGLIVLGAEKLWVLTPAGRALAQTLLT